jgi:CBS domain-containing protein
MEDGNVIGIFTERDVLVRVVGGDLDSHATSVDQVMTPGPHCVTRSMLAKDVMAIATNKRFRHFPVVENEELVGLISIGDLVHFDTTDLESRLNDAILAVKTVSGR